MLFADFESMLPWFIVLGIVVVLGGAAVIVYNGLVNRKVETENAWSQISVQLKRRYDLIPNLVETVKGYATHERETLERVIQARNMAMNAKTVGEQAQAENQLTGALKTLFSVTEAYPDLKANQNFLGLQEELTATENRIGFSRQHYNDVVGKLQQQPDAFPGEHPRRHVRLPEGRLLPARCGRGRGRAKGAAGQVLVTRVWTMQPTFRDLIAANKRNSVLLVVIFCLFTAVLAMLLGLAILFYLAPEAARALNWKEALVVGGLAAGLSLFASWVAYVAGDSLILAVSGARQIQHKDDPELFNVVEEMAIAAGVPMPQVYLMDDPALNAFATGRDPQHGIVAITTGLRGKLKRDELQGVIAHEMSHIRNYDIRLMLLLAVLVGSIVMLSDVFWQLLRWSPSSSSRSSKDSDNGKGGGLVIFLFVVAILLAIIAPILAHIIQLAVSRQREYLADVSAVELTRYPQGLISALRKLEADPTPLQRANRGTAHLFIVNPIKKFENLSATMFASHPPLKDRIQRLALLTHDLTEERHDAR